MPISDTCPTLFPKCTLITILILNYFLPATANNPSKFRIKFSTMNCHIAERDRIVLEKENEFSCMQCAQLQSFI